MEEGISSYSENETPHESKESITHKILCKNYIYTKIIGYKFCILFPRKLPLEAQHIVIDFWQCQKDEKPLQQLNQKIQQQY